MDQKQVSSVNFGTVIDHPFNWKKMTSRVNNTFWLENFKTLIFFFEPKLPRLFPSGGIRRYRNRTLVRIGGLSRIQTHSARQDPGTTVRVRVRISLLRHSRTISLLGNFSHCTLRLGHVSICGEEYVTQEARKNN